VQTILTLCLSMLSACNAGLLGVLVVNYETGNLKFDAIVAVRR